jgi:hypothetical protein
MRNPLTNLAVSKASARDRVSVGKGSLSKRLERPSDYQIMKPLTSPIKSFSPRMSMALGI